MKKKMFSFAVIFMSICIFSTSSFAQEVPGGSGDGSGGTPPDDGGTGGTPTQSIGIHFTRNNGDGTCGDKAQIRLYYTTAPTVAPLLTQIYYQGQPLFANFQPVTGDISGYATKGYVSFCISNTTNLPPAIKLTLTYNASSIQQNVSISGTD